MIYARGVKDLLCNPRYSGAVEPTDSFRSGAAAVRACDEAALASATAQGFDLAYTVCTSPVTHYIAEHELGFRRRVRWDSSKESAQLVVGDRSLPNENNVTLYDKLLRAERVDAAEATVLSPPQLQQERQLHEQLQQCMRQAFSTVSPITLRREMRHLSEGDTHAVVLAKAEQSDEVAGGAALVELDDAAKGAVEVMLIGVWPEFRGRGCARRLLREIDAVASANAWRLIFLTTKPEKAQMYIEHGYREASAEEAERYEAWKEASTRPTEVVAQFHYHVVTLVKAL